MTQNYKKFEGMKKYKLDKPVQKVKKDYKKEKTKS